MTTGRINQVTDRRSLRHDCMSPGRGTLHHAHRSRLWSRRRPSGLFPRGHCPTGLHQTSIPTDGRAPPTTSPSNATHRRGTHAGSPAAKTFHFLRAMLAFNRTVIASFSPATNPFLRPISPSGWRYRHPYGPPRRDVLHGCTTPTVEKRGPTGGSP